MLVTPEWPKFTVQWIKSIKWGKLLFCAPTLSCFCDCYTPNRSNPNNEILSYA